MHANDMHVNDIPVYGWVLIAVLLILLISQASWIFLDASKRGENKWLWGLYGLTNVPSSLIVYLLVTRIFLSGKMCTSCKRKYRSSYRYCPHCGKENDKLTENKGKIIQ